jgi:2-keto-4-pentenoate hydratase/2-oxohepta-3-ene-1,7-dioic acid hydratase in catechol pathway
MKFISFYASPDEIRLGVKTTDGIVDLKVAGEYAGVPVPKTIKELIEGGDSSLERINQVISSPIELLNEDNLQFAPAVSAPGKIICVGTNYRKHALESNLPVPEHPIYFSKYKNSLAGHVQDIVIPSVAKQVDYEVELVVIMGKRAKNVSSSNALNYIFGYATGNDLSARDLQFRNSQWLYGKAIDGFAPLGPYLVTADEVSDPQNLGLRCWINGELRQNSNTSDMIFSVADLISDLSQIMTLEPGDVIYTGTPEGVILGMEEKRWLQPGDEVTCEVEGLGRLVNKLIAEE